MKKKNTLLYLDENLVKKAKLAGINLSGLTEKAIKSSLNAETLSWDPKTYLQELIEDKYAIMIPFRIESIELKDVGPIKLLNAKFNGFNVITGGNATGKTTFLNAIRTSFAMCGRDKLEGKIKLKLRDGDNIDIELNSQKRSIGYKCVLIDESLERLTIDAATKFINYLKNMNLQVIITCLDINALNKAGVLNGINVIKLRESSDDEEIQRMQCNLREIECVLQQKNMMSKREGKLPKKEFIKAKTEMIHLNEQRKKLIHELVMLKERKAK